MLRNPELHRHKRPTPTPIYTVGPGELQRRRIGGLDLPGGSRTLGSGQPIRMGRAWGDRGTHGTHKEGQPALTWWAGGVGWPGPVGTGALGGGSPGAKLMAGSGKGCCGSRGWAGGGMEATDRPGCKKHPEPHSGAVLRSPAKHTLTIFRDPSLTPRACHPARDPFRGTRCSRSKVWRSLNQEQPHLPTRECPRTSAPQNIML